MVAPPGGCLCCWWGRRWVPHLLMAHWRVPRLLTEPLAGAALANGTPGGYVTHWQCHWRVPVFRRPCWRVSVALAAPSRVLTSLAAPPAGAFLATGPAGGCPPHLRHPQRVLRPLAGRSLAGLRSLADPLTNPLAGPAASSSLLCYFFSSSSSFFVAFSFPPFLSLFLSLLLLLFAGVCTHLMWRKSGRGVD